MEMRDKLTKGWVSSIVAVCAIVFSIFLFMDTRYFHSSAAEEMQIQLADALKNQMMMQQKFYADQQKINDMRQLDQLRCSKALIETELKRNPNDPLIKEKLDIVNTQIKALEKTLYGIQ